MGTISFSSRVRRKVTFSYFCGKNPNINIINLSCKIDENISISTIEIKLYE
jgi:hypothetical protein